MTNKEATGDHGPKGYANFKSSLEKPSDKYQRARITENLFHGTYNHFSFFSFFSSAGEGGHTCIYFTDSVVVGGGLLVPYTVFLEGFWTVFILFILIVNASWSSKMHERRVGKSLSVKIQYFFLTLFNPIRPGGGGLRALP